MKITDGVSKLTGVETAYWDSEKSRLTIYYDENVSLEAVGIGVAKYIADRQLQDSVKSITFVSMEAVKE